jgi:hypothetical protein
MATIIDPILTSVALLLQVSGTNLVGSATGFFFQVETNKYLVSNRHVFTGEALPPTVPRPDRIVLPLHSNPTNLTEIGLLSLPIVGTNGAPLWYDHPLGARVDVAMLPLGESVPQGAMVIWLSTNLFPPDSYGGAVGQELFVMGFPQGFHDRLFHLPIVRKAFAGSAYGVPFEGNPYFLVDANLHPGTSGSPVFSAPTHDLPSGVFQLGPKRIYLVGVNSGEIKALPGQKETLGLHAVWYPALLMDIHLGAHGLKTALSPPPSVAPITDTLEKHGYSKRFLPGD